MTNRYSGLLSILLITALCHNTQAGPRVGSWGDQGDGTYRNPVLNADFPDSDVVEHDGTFYMISSKQHMSPGMAILESKDLVNWSLVGHVYDKLSWEPKYGPDQMAGYRFGVWAGDLAYHDGRWYCYMIDTTSGLYMTSAPDIRGPWDEPICMLKKQRWTDPAAFWDDEGKQAYLICNFGRTEGQQGNEIRLFRMSWDGRKLLDDGRVIHRGLGAEAAKIDRIDGQWYIFLAQWFRPDPRPPSAEASSGDRKQLVLRPKGDDIYGPYEQKVVMERGNGVIRSSCQGSLLQAPNGSWWFIHQLVQNSPNPFQGRPQCLEPVTWKDGWPIIGEDVDGDGIGEPVRSAAKPVTGQPISAPQTDDEFDSARLGPQWEWNHNPRDGRWSLTDRPGWLRLKASVPVGKGDFWGACNTISQRIMGTGKGTVVTKLDLSGMRPGQQAGFCRFSVIYHLFGVRMTGSGNRELFLNANGKVTDGPIIRAETLWIRTFNDADKAHFAYSTDGESFARFGPEFTIKFGNWCGDRLGFFCWNGREQAGFIDIDWFRYDYDGPKAAGDSHAEFPKFEYHLFDRIGNRMGQTSLVDIDKDGDLDWVVGQSGKMWWFEYVNPEKWIRHDMGSGAQTDVGGCAFDVDGDGWIDQVSGTAWYRNTAKPREQEFIKYSNAVTANCHDNVAADIDGDGKLDVVAMSDRSALYWYKIGADPTQQWHEHRIGPAVHGAIDPAGIGDLDGDGDNDVVRTNIWFENADGKGTKWIEHNNIDFGQPKARFPLMTKSWVVDLDRDGDNDVVEAEGDCVSGRVAWHENKDGRGGAWARHMIADKTGQDFHSLAVADFDSDGDLDAFSGGGPLTQEPPHKWFIWENLDGKGGQFKEHIILSGKRCHEAKAADVDGDGDIDICSKPWNGDEHVYLRNMLKENSSK